MVLILADWIGLMMSPLSPPFLILDHIHKKANWNVFLKNQIKPDTAAGKVFRTNKIASFGGQIECTVVQERLSKTGRRESRDNM